MKNYERKNQDLSKKLNKKEELEKKITDNNVENSDLNILKSELEALIEEITLLQREIVDAEDTYNETLTEQTKIKKEEIKNKEQEIKSLNSQESTQATNIYQQLISDLGVARSQNSEKIADLKSQNKIKKMNNDLFNLVANKDGVVHYTTPVKIGIGVQAFQPLAQIDNGKDSKLIVESYIPAQDRSRVRVGNSVKVSVTGVNQTKYGMLQGKINEISAGTVFQNGSEENSQLLYQIIIELNNTNLKSNKDTIKVEASMPVVANIIYDKETYLEWILNELNLKK